MRTKFKLGQRVQINAEGSDDCFDPEFAGQIGFISKIERKSDDDYYTVTIEDGRSDGFWSEEMQDADVSADLISSCCGARSKGHIEYGRCSDCLEYTSFVAHRS